MGCVPVVIPSRFNGPPESAHGGYACGRVAALVDAPAVEVTLRRPPPLDHPLQEHRDGPAVALHDGDEIVATARPAELAVDGPPPVGLDAAAAARERYAWHDEHPFPGCFGCGPARDPEDALCLYTGPVGDGRFAVPWTPAPWAGRGGVVEPVFTWAALDCPSAAPFHGDVEGALLLGRLTLAIEGPVAVGAPHVIQSWAEGVDGRKRHSAVALYTAGGERRARGRAVWFEVPRQR
jgi:hypothetical protein